MKSLTRMRSLSITVSAAVVLGLSQGESHAQVPSLPDIASRGVQCQWIDEALFALAQTSPRDVEDSLSVQRLRRLQSDMQPATRMLFDELAMGYRGSDAYDNGGDADAAVVGRYMDRGLRACAKAWFPEADASRVKDCSDAHLAGMTALNSRRHALPQAKALEIAQGAAPSVRHGSSRSCCTSMVTPYLPIPTRRAQGASAVVPGSAVFSVNGNGSNRYRWGGDSGAVASPEGRPMPRLFNALSLKGVRGRSRPVA